MGDADKMKKLGYFGKCYGCKRRYVGCKADCIDYKQACLALQEEKRIKRLEMLACEKNGYSWGYLRKRN